MAMDMCLKAMLENRISDQLTQVTIGQLNLDNIEINSDGELMITAADDTNSIKEINLGKILPEIGDDGNWYLSGKNLGISAKGDTGAAGEQGTKGDVGADGKDGEDGFSPTITENSNNTDDVYKLDITTVAGTFTTPNLKGADGNSNSSSSVTASYVTEQIESAIGDIDTILDSINGEVI